MPEKSFRAQFAAFNATLSAGSCLRFAPTPSGFLHIGNALNFVLNYLSARSTPGARILLRIDDLDADRKRPAYLEDIFESLNWLGLDYDDGPRSPEDFETNWSQWRRMDLYHQVLNDLRARDLLFGCRKSRKELAAFGDQYPPAFRNQGIDVDEPDCSWRIKSDAGLAMSDFVVRRRDGIPAYQVASLADDLHFGITHVVRGEDLRPSTEAQRYLAKCLDYQSFSAVCFLHHPLIKDGSGIKLSKSAGAASLKAMREMGEGPGAVFRLVAEMLGIDGVDTLLDLQNRIGLPS
jgi:glutamyl/glutaminyl-tRNA synthetase